MLYLFVYGTLRRGYRNRWAQLLHRSADFVGAARVRGRLFQFGSYPGIRLHVQGATWVAGEVFRLRDPRRILSVLDRYEGPDYRRVMIRATLAGGGDLHCWIYELRSFTLTGSQ